MRDLQVELDAAPANPTEETFIAFLDAYVAGRDGIAPSTRASYETLINTHVRPHVMADLPLASVTPVDGEAVMTSARNRIGPKGTHLSPKTLRNLFTLLRSACTAAAETGRVSFHPMRGMRPPVVRHDPDAVAFWTPEEARRFLAHAEAEKDLLMTALVQLALVTGMRLGELLGLRWIDVDDSTRTLAVKRSRTAVRYQMVEGPPKTPRSRRMLAVSDAHRKALEMLAERRDHNAEFFGPAWADSGYLFTTDTGEPVHSQAVRQRFTNLCLVAGVTRIRFHDLRHTHASIALAAGENIKTISARLGHADVGFTLRQYAHLMPENQGFAADKVIGALFTDPNSCDQACDQGTDAIGEHTPEIGHPYGEGPVGRQGLEP